MLNILIVDDEQIVRVYLQSIINWEEEECRLVGTCKNGMEALEILDKQPIDLVLTDLKMPKMNGLQLIEEIKVRNLQTSVIVLSNHSDYDLVRQAMKLGALDYYIKINLQPADVRHFLKQVREDVNQKLLKQSKLREEEKRQIENFKLGRKSFLTTVLKGDVYYTELELQQYVEMYHLLEPQLSLYRLRLKESEKIEQSQFPYLDAIISEQLMRFDFDIVHINQEKILVMIYEREVLEEPILSDCWLTVVKNIHHYLNTELQASKRLVINSIRKLTACTKLFQEGGAPDRDNPIIPDKDLAHYRPEIQVVLNFIHENYMERITLPELATYACLNEAYLSRLFKMETKKTLNSYVNELRIYKAKELLKQPDIMVKEVAQLVGIKDQLYFNRVFKKFCGESPSEYQDRVKKVHF